MDHVGAEAEDFELGKGAFGEHVQVGEFVGVEVEDFESWELGVGEGL